MKEDISVVVGTYDETRTGRAERESLARIIERHGFKVERAPIAWPMDLYVYCDGKYVHGTAGEGGCVHLGDGYLIASENMFIDPESHIRADAEAMMRPHYPGRRVHSMPAGYNAAEAGMLESCSIIDHIDMTSLLIPSRGLLLVDQSFYRRNMWYGENPKRRIAEIAEKESLTLEYYNPSSNSSSRYFPMNCLVLPWKKGEEIVFANSNVKPFLRLLNKYDITFAEVDFKYTPQHMLGSIRCCTNVKKRKTEIYRLLRR
ncbi:MAG: hypothetical protein AABY09_04555 [Nanoarchaeota archaeon]